MISKSKLTRLNLDFIGLYLFNNKKENANIVIVIQKVSTSLYTFYEKDLRINYIIMVRKTSILHHPIATYIM